MSILEEVGRIKMGFWLVEYNDSNTGTLNLFNQFERQLGYTGVLQAQNTQFTHRS